MKDPQSTGMSMEQADRAALKVGKSNSKLALDPNIGVRLGVSVRYRVTGIPRVRMSLRVGIRVRSVKGSVLG